MSSLIVEVCRVGSVEKHPNADRLSICTVKGWRVCAGRDPETGRNQFEPGDKCVYIPPDSVLPPDLADRLNVTRYLSPLAKNADGVRPPGGRVRVARLRGEPSYGLILEPDDPGLEVGTDVAALYGITKWEPPPVRADGDAERPHPAFHTYTDIENYRNFPDLLPDGEEVVFTEKVHGMNCRLGLVRTDGGGGAPGWTFMAGSHDVRRKEFDARGRRSRFWECLTDPVRDLLVYVSSTPDPAWGGAPANGVVLFGEVYGSGVQDLWYGLENGRFGFRAFDLAVNGRYLDFDVKAALLARFGVAAVPILYRGPFSRARVEEYVSGPTTLCPPDWAGRFKGREGIVITPVRERAVATPARVFDRLVLKAISFEYLERKGGTEYH
jgi:RNA ligase (TIGR02306 family)